MGSKRYRQRVDSRTLEESPERELAAGIAGGDLADARPTEHTLPVVADEAGADDGPDGTVGPLALTALRAPLAHVRHVGDQVPEALGSRRHLRHHLVTPIDLSFPFRLTFCKINVVLSRAPSRGRAGMSRPYRLGRREEAAQQTREKILQAAADLVAEHGSRGMTIKAVAERSRRLARHRV